MTITVNWTAAIVIALLIASVYRLDAEDHSGEWPTSSELNALQATEAGTAKREAAGQALCTAERGPQSEARWTPDGDLACTLRRTGPVLTAKVSP